MTDGQARMQAMIEGLKQAIVDKCGQQREYYLDSRDEIVKAAEMYKTIATAIEYLVDLMELESVLFPVVVAVEEKVVDNEGELG